MAQPFYFNLTFYAFHPLFDLPNRKNLKDFTEIYVHYGIRKEFSQKGNLGSLSANQIDKISKKIRVKKAFSRQNSIL